MSTQSKKPELAGSDFSETFTSLDELFPLNEYKIESDTLSDQRSSTEPEPLQNGRRLSRQVGRHDRVQGVSHKQRDLSDSSRLDLVRDVESRGRKARRSVHVVSDKLFSP